MSFRRRTIAAVRRAPGSRRRFHAAMAGLLALLFQVLVPLGQAIPLASGSDGLPRTLVVCTANGGLRTVPLPTAQTPASSTATNGPLANAGPQSGLSPLAAACSVCLAYAAGGHLTLPPLVVLPLPQNGHQDTIFPTALALTVDTFGRLPPARAPPHWGLA